MAVVEVDGWRSPCEAGCLLPDEDLGPRLMCCGSCGAIAPDEEGSRNCPECSKFWSVEAERSCPDCEDGIEGGAAAELVVMFRVEGVFFETVEDALEYEADRPKRLEAQRRFVEAQAKREDLRVKWSEQIKPRVKRVAVGLFLKDLAPGSLDSVVWRLSQVADSPGVTPQIGIPIIAELIGAPRVDPMSRTWSEEEDQRWKLITDFASMVDKGVGAELVERGRCADLTLSGGFDAGLRTFRFWEKVAGTVPAGWDPLPSILEEWENV